jgi:hypothetical protein
MATVGLSNTKLVEIELRAAVPALVDKFADATGIRALTLPTVEIGKCSGANALLLDPFSIRVDNSLAYSLTEAMNALAHEVAHSVMFQNGIRTGIDESRSNLLIRFNKSDCVIDNLPALLIINALEDASACQFEMLCTPRYPYRRSDYEETLHMLRLDSPHAKSVVENLLPELTGALRKNDVLDVKELLEGGWPNALYKKFCDIYAPSRGYPMSVDNSAGYYGVTLALHDDIQSGYDYKGALNHGIKLIMGFKERLTAYLGEIGSYPLLRAY